MMFDNEVLDYLKMAKDAASELSGYEDIEESIDSFISCIEDEIEEIEAQKDEEIEENNRFIMGRQEI